MSDYQPYLSGLNQPGIRSIPDDWTFDVANMCGKDELRDARTMLATLPQKLNVLVLYGSLRQRYVVLLISIKIHFHAFRSYSQLVSFEVARILDHMGADVKIFNPSGLPLKDDTTDNHPKVRHFFVHSI